MAPGPSTEPAAAAGDVLALHGGTLLRVALASIEYGLAHGRALAVNIDDYPREVRAKLATLVTLMIGGKLRGCIGTSVARNPLVKDVANNAYAAAFKDRRFKALTGPEMKNTAIKLSILSPPESLPVGGELDLLKRLRPGTDGLILEHGSMRSLFLPDVWETLPEPRRFVSQLKVKAGLPARYWSNMIAAYRFTTSTTPLTPLSGAP